MKKTGLLLLIVAIFISLFQACKKEDSTPQFHPTPYSLALPSFAAGYLPPMPIPADNPLTEEGVALGRKLFYSKTLSLDGSQSCASCHKQENAFNDPNQFSKGVSGALGTRNSMTISNIGWSDRFFWDGRRSTLEGQAHDPVTNPVEMGASWPAVVQRLQADAAFPDMFFKAFGTRTVDSLLVMKAIAQFERTLISLNSLYDRAHLANPPTAALTLQQINGLSVFFEGGRCAVCHASILFTDHSFRNNGLDALPQDSGLAAFTHNPGDYGKFKVPSLRNIALTGPYMHDGRFKTLEEVVSFYGDAVNHNSPNIDPVMASISLNKKDRDDLLAFLHVLTDSSFITNPAFSDPH